MIFQHVLQLGIMVPDQNGMSVFTFLFSCFYISFSNTYGTLLLLLSCITIPAAFLFLLFILIFQLNVQVYLGALSARRYSAVTLLSVVMELSVAAVIVIFIICGAK